MTDKIIDQGFTDRIAAIPRVKMMPTNESEPHVHRRLYYAPSEDEIVEKVRMATRYGLRDAFVYSAYKKTSPIPEMFFVDMGYIPMPGDTTIW